MGLSSSYLSILFDLSLSFPPFTFSQPSSSHVTKQMYALFSPYSISFSLSFSPSLSLPLSLSLLFPYSISSSLATSFSAAHSSLSLEKASRCSKCMCSVQWRCRKRRNQSRHWTQRESFEGFEADRRVEHKERLHESPV